MLKQRSINQLAFTSAVVGVTLFNHGSFEVYFKSSSLSSVPDKKHNLCENLNPKTVLFSRW